MAINRRMAKLGATIAACACLYGSCEFGKKAATYLDSSDMALEQRMEFLNKEIETEYKQLPFKLGEETGYISALESARQSIRPVYERIKPSIDETKAKIEKNRDYGNYLLYGAFGLLMASIFISVSRPKKEEQ